MPSGLSTPTMRSDTAATRLMCRCAALLSFSDTPKRGQILAYDGSRPQIAHRRPDGREVANGQAGRWPAASWRHRPSGGHDGDEAVLIADCRLMISWPAATSAGRRPSAAASGALRRGSTAASAAVCAAVGTISLMIKHRAVDALMFGA